MYRSSRRKPPAALPKRSTTPNPRRKTEENRPAWDDTCGDVSKYKATPEEIARRKQQRVSKNLITAGKLQTEGSSYALSPEPHSSGTRDPAGTPEQTTSPAIDYGAVLKLLNRRGPTPDSQPVSQGNSTDLGARRDDTTRGDQGATSHSRWSTRSGDAPEPGSPSHVRQLIHECDEVLDATLSSFARMDITAPPHLPTAVTSTTKPNNAAKAVARTTALLDPAAGAWSPPPAGAHGAYQAAGTGGVSGGVAASYGGVMSGESGMGSPQQAKTVAESLREASASTASAAVAAVQSRQQTLEAQVARIESTVQRLAASGSGGASQLPPAMLDELRSLQQTTRELQSEQSQLRSELEGFTRHATGLITTLQTQMQELLRANIAQQQSQPMKAYTHTDPAPYQHSPASTSYTQAGPTLLQSTREQQPQQPSVGLFADLPTGTGVPPRVPGTAHSGAQPPSAAVSSHGATQRSPSHRVGGPSVVPVSNFDDELSIPSYSAMRRSAATAAFTPATAQSAGLRGTGLAPPRPQATMSAMGGAGYEDLSSSSGLQRTVPAPYAPRNIGGNPILSGTLPASLAHITGTAVPLGPTLPVSTYGEAQVGALADYLSADLTLNKGLSPGGSFRGRQTAFGVLPEPLTLNMGSNDDFKIVQVGGSGMVGSGAGGLLPPTRLSAENSLSLAAHTAAAMRARGHGRK